MIVALDVHCRAGGARAAALLFDRWEDELPESVRTKWIEVVAPYEPGAFYKRELPCLLALLQELPLAGLEAIVIDGFVYLGADRPGLGARLHSALAAAVPVIGVAKTRFHGCADVAVPLLRGNSHSPLWITAAGMEAAAAAGCIARMAGPHRMPALLTQVDRETRNDD
ncbi:MAG: endonuclease V [Chitinophagaceae bacterium]|nr:MAG: endonuclease V [Chitinophagaceae bacterium]